MQIFEGKNIFIKDNISRNIETTSGYLKTLDPFVARTIPQKDTLCGAKSKFAFIVLTKIGQHAQPKTRRELYDGWVPKRRCT
jgi:hypothetical protein